MRRACGLMQSAVILALAGTVWAGEPGLREVGIASFYGHELAGRRTASGARYDPAALTAAHPTLPFGTLVTVVALKSGRQVTVEVNDRGPFTRGRKIDLSLRAAEVLGIVKAGVARVRISPAEGR